MMRMLHITIAAIAFTFPALAVFSQVTSWDGQWISRLEDGGQVLVITNAETGEEAHRRRLISRDHIQTRAAAMVAAEARKSLLIALEGAPELWEIALFPDAGPFHDGFVHSYEKGMEESLPAEAGMFARRRILLEAPLIGLRLEPERKNWAYGIRADGARVEINLIVGREVFVFAPDEP